MEMPFAPIYNTICSDDAGKRFPINPYEEFLTFCFDKYFGQIKSDKALSALFPENELTTDALLKFISLLPGISVTDVETANGEVPSVDIKCSLNDSAKYNCVITFFKHATLTSIDSRNNAEYLTCYIALDKFAGFDNFGVDRRYNNFTFYDCSVPGTLAMFAAALLGLSDIREFAKKYKIRMFTVNTIEGYIRQILSDTDNSYSNVYNRNTFTISVSMKDGTIYAASYSYDNFIKSLNIFKKYLKENACIG